MSASAPTNAPAQVLRPDRRRNRLGYNILALVTAALMAFPVYWLLVSSLRPNHEIRSYDQTLWPSSLTFDNFARAVKQDNFATAIQSSLIVSVTAVVGGMIIATLAALAIGRFRFFGRKALMMVMILVSRSTSSSTRWEASTSTGGSSSSTWYRRCPSRPS
jgi:N,N'-diacetylchitobiose transport system permease protein